MFSLLSVEEADVALQVRTSWTVTSVLEGDVTVYSGSAQYDLLPEADSYVIKRKKTIVINDARTMLDVYSI
jgi:benzoate/toluate 1,2-dioxygenase beta subunit